MTIPTVGELYDALHAFEAGRRGVGAYPVHKRLQLDAPHEDIYDWLAEQLALGDADRVLDAGCGVGFGTLRLAAHGVARATGITLSRREAARASEVAARSAVATRVEFHCGSFDRLAVGAFDAVIAVESLKHSADLAASVRALRAALAAGGRLAVVEDVFDGDQDCARARRVASDWLLPRLYTERDYRALLGAVRVVDLTPAVRRRSRVALAARAAALGSVLPWLPPARAAAWRAFRGGLHLEKLYAAGLVRYLAFVTSRTAAEVP